MNKNPFEKGQITPDNTKERQLYRQYLKRGGNINKEDWKSALERAKDTTVIDQTLITNAKNIARIAGIELDTTKNTVDPKIILYGILRRDVRAEGVERHHDEMRDEHIFAEVLRMLGDIDSLKKLIEAYKKVNPNMSFNYPEEEHEEEEKKAA